MRLPAALRANLSRLRRPPSSSPEDGPNAPSDVQVILRPAANRITIEVPSRVTDEALTEAAGAVRSAMRDVDGSDASRLLFTVAAALGEIVAGRDIAWLQLCVDELTAEAADAAGEPPC